jgi:cell division protein FtsQ
VSPGRLTRKVLGGIVGLAVSVAIWFGAPRMLGHLEFFRVRRVELVGLQYQSAAAVLGALRVPARLSVFDDLGELQRRATALPGVASARVSRRLPGTLVVEVAERLPVALVPRRGVLVLMDGAGRALPFDPSLGAPDLPVATAADVGMAGLLARVQDLEPGLFARIQSATRRGADVVLDLGGQRWWFRPDASAEVIRAVMAVAQDLDRKGRKFGELDARFAGQVVVRPVPAGAGVAPGAPGRRGGGRG